MVTIWIILGLLLVIFFGLLFIPITLTIDTEKRLYRLKIAGLGDGTIVPSWDTDELLLIKLRLWLWRWEISAGHQLLKRRDLKQKQKEKKKKKAPLPFRRIRSRSFKVLRSFRIHQFELNLDTYDPVWNAWLYPFAFFVRRRGHAFSINFNHYNALRLKMSNRLFNILWAILV